MRQVARIVPKVWGEEHWLVNRDYCGKRLLLREGHRCSLHHHLRKHETFYVQSGLIYLELGEESMLLEPGEIVTIEPGVPHRFTGIVASEIIEFSTHHDDEDSYRTTQSGQLTQSELLAIIERFSS